MSERGSEERYALEAELGGIEHRVQRRIEPGVGGVVIAGAVLVLLLAATLPWVGPLTGWQVAIGEGQLGPLPRLFAWTAIGFGVLGSAAALVARRWVLAWVCALGCGFSILDGVLAVWSRQTAPDPGPGVGLVLALVAIVALTGCWVRVAWSSA